MNLSVKRLATPPGADSEWDTLPWRRIPAERIRHFMGNRPQHFPKTDVKIAYDDTAIYVMFRVEDQYVRATAAAHQDSVCGDSCVEFFFTPGTDVKKGYFNLEMNCGGTMLFKFQVIPRQSTDIEPADVERVEVAHSLPRIVEPEMTAPTIWTVEYRLPTDMLAKYMPEATRPAPGVNRKERGPWCRENGPGPIVLQTHVLKRPVAANLQRRSAQSPQRHAQLFTHAAFVSDP